MSTDGTRRRGLLFVVSSPSGAGKTTLSRRLLAEHAELRFSVSYTTRPRRTGEREGVDYHFVSDETFDRMIDEGAFVEFAVVHGRRYGTSMHTVRAALTAGQQVLLDIDYQGAARLSEQFKHEACLTYILPPSLSVLEQRLRSRNTDTTAVIEARLLKAREELRQYPGYRYLIVNSDIETAYAELDAIYRCERAMLEGWERPAPSSATVSLARSCLMPQRSHLAEELLRAAGGEERFLSPRPAAAAPDR